MFRADPGDPITRPIYGGAARVDARDWSRTSVVAVVLALAVLYVMCTGAYGRGTGDPGNSTADHVDDENMGIRPR